MAMQTTLSFNSEEFFSLNIQDLVKLLDLYNLLKFSTYPFFLQLKKDWKLPAKDQCRVSVKLHVTKLPNLIKAKFYLKNSSLTQFFSRQMSTNFQIAITFSFAVTLLLMLAATNVLLVGKGDTNQSNYVVAMYMLVLPVCLWLSRGSLAQSANNKLGQD